MTSDHRAHIRELIERLGRVAAAEEWAKDLNPAQRAALRYLARANRFSRAPSHVADFLLTTRGTASQTLKALERKGLVTATPSETDSRSVRYALTAAGETALAGEDAVDTAIAALSTGEAEALRDRLTQLAKSVLARRGDRAFGVCRTCRHHLRTSAGARCALLDIALADAEADQICHEHAPAA